MDGLHEFLVVRVTLPFNLGFSLSSQVRQLVQQISSLIAEAVVFDVGDQLV